MHEPESSATSSTPSIPDPAGTVGPGTSLPPTRGAGPAWLGEVVDTLRLRKDLVARTAIGVAVGGFLFAMIAPGILPPRPLVGAAIGIAACLLAVAAAVAVDAGDVIVRGPRHIRASGARLRAVVPPPTTSSDLDDLVTAIEAGERRRRTVIALAPAAGPVEDAVSGGDPGVRAVRVLADGLARSFARRGRRTMFMDVVEGDGSRGLSDIASGAVTFGAAVEIDPDGLSLARVGAGADAAAARRGMAGLVGRLPSDIEVLIVAMPNLAAAGALDGVRHVDELILVARTHRTARVDLIASLDAADSAAVQTDVLLLDGGPPAEGASAGTRLTSAAGGATHEGADAPTGQRPILQRPILQREARPGAPDVGTSGASAPVQSSGVVRTSSTPSPTGTARPRQGTSATEGGAATKEPETPSARAEGAPLSSTQEVRRVASGLASTGAGAVPLLERVRAFVTGTPARTTPRPAPNATVKEIAPEATVLRGDDASIRVVYPDGPAPRPGALDTSGAASESRPAARPTSRSVLDAPRDRTPARETPRPQVRPATTINASAAERIRGVTKATEAASAARPSDAAPKPLMVPPMRHAEEPTQVISLDDEDALHLSAAVESFTQELRVSDDD